MRSLLGRFHRPMSRGTVGNMLAMNNLGDGSTLSLDFTTMGDVLDPRLTFSRASTATFVNSQGYVEYAGANLLLQGSNLGSASWTATGLTSRNASTDPNGSTQAVELSEDATTADHRVVQLTSQNLNGLVYTSSVYMKAGTNRTVGFIRDNNVSSDALVFYTLTGAGTRTIANVAWGIVASIERVGTTDWYRCVFTIKAAGAANVQFGTASGTAYGNWSFAGTVGNSIHVWGAQVNLGSTAQTYYPTTTPAYHAPRFDYSPTNIGEPRGLLIEGSAINSALYSENINPNSSPQNVYWVVAGAGASVTPVSQTDPANGSTASRCILGTSTVGRVYQGVSTTIGETYTMSFWAKSISGNTALHFWHYNSATGNYTAVTVGTSWARYQVTILARSAGGFVEFGVANLTATAATIDLWGMQIELGSGASSYIPTGASQVTRAVDTAIIAAGTNFSSWYTGGTTGTFVSNWYGSAATSTARTVIATSDQTTKHLHMYQTPSALTLRLADFGAAATVTTANNLIANALTKGAFSYAGTATSLCLNGGTVATGTLAFTVAPTWLSIGGPSITGTTITDTSIMLNNSIRTIKYYPTRLTDAQIKDITT